MPGQSREDASSVTWHTSYAKQSWLVCSDQNTHHVFLRSTSECLTVVPQMLSYGCTRLEIGLQSTYEDVARDTNRGHTVAAVGECFQMAKNAGFKVGLLHSGFFRIKSFVCHGDVFICFPLLGPCSCHPANLIIWDHELLYQRGLPTCRSCNSAHLVHANPLLPPVCFCLDGLCECAQLSCSGSLVLRSKRRGYC